jgi:hypothetical protein
VKCHYCGKEVWLVRHLLDGDFCSPAHRKQYHDRLRRSLRQLPQAEGPPAPPAEFRLRLDPAASEPDRARAGAGLISSWPRLRLPETNLKLSPRFGQTFFGPDAAGAAAPGAAARSVWRLEPLAPEPRLHPLDHAWNLAARPAVATGDRFLRGHAVAIDPGNPALPISSPPEALLPRAVRMVAPRMVGTLLTDQAAPCRETGIRLERPAAGRLALWIAARAEAVNVDARLVSNPQALGFAAACPACRDLGLTPCAPTAFVSPLLAGDTVARAALEPVRPAPVAQPPSLAPFLPRISNGRRPRLAGETAPLWKIAPVAPWTLALEASAQQIAPQPTAMVLPTLMPAPIRPGLAAETEIHRVEARPAMALAAAAGNSQTPFAPAPRPALAPAITASRLAAALPPSAVPRLAGSSSMVPQELAALPGAPAGIPIPPQGEPLAQALRQSAAAAESCLPPAGALTSLIPAFVPRGAAPRASGEIAACSVTATKALPPATTAGLTRPAFAAVAPPASEFPLRPVTPVPAPIARQALAADRMPVPVAGAGMPPLWNTLPLDLYVRRVRATPRRAQEWQALPARMAKPDAMPGVWPARFEQQVLLDWRRRYPSRQVAAAPKSARQSAKVTPIGRPLSALERFRRNAPYFVKAAAAAAVIGAVVWFSGSTHGVSSTVAADRHWLRDAIAQRATLVMSDNFRSGLHLWEGHQNWARSWAYSSDGFVRTGQLALYKPTMQLKDYRLEFFAQIESKSVDWVFRAKDEQNYYAMKLSVTEPGLRPLVSMVRYPVAAGLKGKRVQVPLPIMMHNNTPYHVALDVKGSHFRAFVEDQEIDSWTDDRLRAGGVGFFSEAGEHARLYWVKVSNNTDWLGRLCGMLSGKAENQISGLWDPADPRHSLASLDPGVWDGAKNVDMKKGALAHT